MSLSWVGRGKAVENTGCWEVRLLLRGFGIKLWEQLLLRAALNRAMQLAETPARGHCMTGQTGAVLQELYLD